MNSVCDKQTDRPTDDRTYQIEIIHRIRSITFMLSNETKLFRSPIIDKKNDQTY